MKLHFLKILFVVLLLKFNIVFSQTEGTPDISFNSVGYKIQQTGSSFSWGSALHVFQNGKIVIAGYSNQNGVTHITVLRFNYDGSLDASFADNGIAFIPVQLQSQAAAIAIQDDEKIVVAGVSVDSSSSYYFTAVRLNSNGLIDNSFAVNGIAKTHVEFSTNVYSANLRNDGKIIVTGYTAEPGNKTGISQVCYHTNGSLDSTYGTGGISIVKFDHSSDVEAWAADIDNQNRIVTTGLIYCPDLDKNLLSLIRFNPDGNLDSAFGNAGLVETCIDGYNTYGNAIVIQPDNKILIAASADSPSIDIPAVLRYNTNGTLDSTFGTGGIVRFSFEPGINAEAYGINLQNDGKILITGVSGTNAMNTNGNYGLIRLHTNGAIDNTFGTNGSVSTDISNGKNDVAFCVQQQFDGKIVISGVSFDGNHYSISLARYHGNPTGIPIVKKSDDVILYPNPVSNWVQIDGLQNKQFIEIRTIQGQIIKCIKISDATNHFDISDLPQGIYFMNIFAEEQVHTMRFIKE